MVQEMDNGIKCWNQPAGHVELNEDILLAAIREAKEETRYDVELTGFVGIYQSLHQTTNEHFVRVCFTATALNEQPEAELDNDIIQATWLDLDDLLQDKYTLRSPLTKQCLEDFAKGTIYPIELIKPIELNKTIVTGALS